MTQNVSVDDETARQFLEGMLRIDIFEEETKERFGEGEIPGFVHLSGGHEGSHIGMGAAMGDDDWLAVGGARLIGQYIAKGVPLPDIMAELYGRVGGSNKGHGGQMHVSDIGRKLYGHAATIGSGQNPAVGLALAEEIQETDNVAVTTIGDGGTSRGSFHTALVFAAYWDLPVVFVIENNEWAISTPAESLSPDHLSDYGIPHKMATESIDGSDVEAVYHTVSEAIERARNGGGPTVIESRVARLVPHFEGDKETYRDTDEYERLKEEKDPIENYRERLLERDIVTETGIEDMIANIETEVKEAVEFARESPEPEPEAAYDHVYRTPLYGQGENQ
ncbi:thiamine pyrophosphate-dependent dehydrogenase E1 component subunit alpha [Salinadaptatus halalkaliphilus]|uniref:Thiamine pyrophosphate-dependent dehydrogenase E1 component subunit alpha n=1 Tax=Salinadaptatus halalkaliphilus TaxID=2419781 RepID=A0A4S3TJ26_9EURY|nr:thiamine pyrophosphate-dependent dehydrogenase E1 component subunit alpha [Salinadaptatus halalkaliphilus]THE64059.1 thiamine pyrophosphate-dependent dehydrogenase E1 component subunit alpha [Salinadaptatus halalkaliphilus]